MHCPVLTRDCLLTILQQCQLATGKYLRVYLLTLYLGSVSFFRVKFVETTLSHALSFYVSGH